MNEAECAALKAAFLAAQQRIRDRNSAFVKERHDMPRGAPASEVEDRLVTRNGYTREVARTIVNRVEGDPKNDAESREVMQKLGDDADAEIQAAQGPDSPKVSAAWISGKMDAVRTKIRDGFDHAVNNIPKGVNAVGNAMLKQFYNWKNFLDLGATEGGHHAMVGDMAAAALGTETDALWHEHTKNGGQMGKDDFREALLARAVGQESGKSYKEFASELRSKMAEKPAPIHKQVERLLQLGETMGSDSMINKFLREKGQILAKIGKELFESGNIKEMYDRYFPNQIALENQDGDWYDNMIYGKEVSKSLFTKQKQYANYLEAMIDGHMPSSMKYDEVLGNYLSRSGKKLRVSELAKNLKANAALPDSHNDKAQVSISADESMAAVAVKPHDDISKATEAISEKYQEQIDKIKDDHREEFDKLFQRIKEDKSLTDEERAGQKEDLKSRLKLVRDNKIGKLKEDMKLEKEAAREWEIPEAPGNKKYQNLGGLNPQLEGIYVHPEIYRGLTHVFETGFEKDGLVKAAFRLSGVWKSTALAFSFFHEGSLRQKAISLSRAHGLGTALAAMNLKSDTLVTEGLSTLAGGADHPLLLDLVRNDLSLHQHDMSKNPLLARMYDMKTGDKKTLTKAADLFNSATNFFHNRIFEKVQPGMKISMAVRLVKSDWFTNLKGKDGETLDYDSKLQTVSKIINDTFGGQNLESIGRTRLAQTLMQAVFLAPDWQESKMKRMFGTVLAQDPNARRSFQVAVAAEFAMMFILKVAAQQLYSGIMMSVYHDPTQKRSLKEMAEDIWNGRLGSLYIGKTKEDKPRDKFMTFGGSANQDLRVPLTFVKGIVGTMKGDWSAMPSQLGQEVRSKLSPLMSAGTGYLEHKTEQQKRADLKKPASGYDYPYLPMSVGQTIAALTGGLGEDRANEAIQSQVSGTLGMPIQLATSLDTIHAAQKKGAKQDENAKRKLRLLK